MVERSIFIVNIRKNTDPRRGGGTYPSYGSPPYFYNKFMKNTVPG